MENKLHEVINQIISESRNEKKTITLTMNDYFLKIVDLKVAQCEGMSRNAWILQAIQEKIEKEE